jgi:hypothetical protein
MIKKIKITDKYSRRVFRDTTIGKIYRVHSRIGHKGQILLYFTDDIGEGVDIYADGNGYEVVEED